MLTGNWKIPMYSKNQMSIGSQKPNRGERERERQRETEGERKGARKIIGRQEAAVPEVAATAEAQIVCLS